MHTLRDGGWPTPIERGAEFLHGRPRSLWALVTRARLSPSRLQARHHLVAWAGETGQRAAAEVLCACTKPVVHVH